MPPEHKDSLIERIIEWSARNKFMVFMLVGALFAGGIYSMRNTALDAIPDLSDVQVIVFTEWDGIVNNGLTPAGITVLASSVVPNNIPPTPSRHESTIYERGRAFVFAAGTIFFGQNIRSQPAVGQIVANLLTRAGASAYRP